MKSTPKKDAVAIVKRGTVRQKNIRQNANIKSRAIVSTDSSSSDDDNSNKILTKTTSPPVTETTRNVPEKLTLLTPIEVGSEQNKSSALSKVTYSSSEDEGHDIEKVGHKDRKKYYNENNII